MTEFFQLVLNGIVSGSVLAISALGITIIYGLLRIANFAYGDYLTLGAFMAFWVNVSLGQSLILATLFAVVAIALFSLGLEYTFWRPLRRRGADFVSLFLSSLGLALVLRYAIFLVVGPESRSYDVDQFAVDTFFGLRLARGATIGIVITVVTILAIGLLLAYTTIGRSLRAVGDDPRLAAASGIDPDRVVVHAWLLAGALAGLAGVIQALIFVAFDGNMGGTLILSMYVAVILGGIGDPYGALLGGLAVGVLTELSTWQVLAGGVDPRYKPVVAFVMLGVALIVRPYGVFGRARLR
jgi:branched-subunit amino acid ABC-type transport system permease component